MQKVETTIEIIVVGFVEPFSNELQREYTLEGGQSAFQKSEEAAQKANSILQLIYQNAMKVFK